MKAQPSNPSNILGDSINDIHAVKGDFQKDILKLDLIGKKLGRSVKSRKRINSKDNPVYDDRHCETNTF